MSETFDLTAFIEGSSYPKKSVVLYTNVAALKKREELDNKLNGVDASGKPVTVPLEVLEATQEAYDKVVAELEKTALTFELQGMPFRIATKIANIFDEEVEATHEQLIELIQKSIVGVTDAKGAKSSVPTTETLELLHERMSPGEFNKLLNSAVEVNFSAASYEAEIDAGFPVGSTDVE